MTDWLRSVVEGLRFLKRREERLNALRAQERQDRAAERQHQLELVDKLGGMLIQTIKSQQEGILELARAQQSQASAFSGWVESFNKVPEPLEPTIAASLDESDDFEDVFATLQGVDPETIPAEFRLAFAQHQLDRQRETSSGDREDSSY